MTCCISLALTLSPPFYHTLRGLLLKCLVREYHISSSLYKFEVVLQGTSKTLKRKNSALQGSVSRKSPRMDVHNFVFKLNEADLHVPGKLTVEKLREAMELDVMQFKEITVRTSSVTLRLSLTRMHGSGATLRLSSTYTESQYYLAFVGCR